MAVIISRRSSYCPNFATAPKNEERSPASSLDFPGNRSITVDQADGDGHIPEWRHRGVLVRLCKR